MEEDFKNILKEHHDIIYRISKSFSYYSYEDLYQEICIQIWKSLKFFKSESQLKTWIYRVALNTAVSYKNKKDKSPEFLTTFENNEINLSQDELSSDKNAQKVMLLYKAINILGPIDRSFIILHLEGHDYEEMSQILGVSVNLIGVKLNRIRKRLQLQLKQFGYGRI